METNFILSAKIDQFIEDLQKEDIGDFSNFEGLRFELQQNQNLNKFVLMSPALCAFNAMKTELDKIQLEERSRQLDEYHTKAYEEIHLNQINLENALATATLENSGRNSRILHISRDDKKVLFFYSPLNSSISFRFPLSFALYFITFFSFSVITCVSNFIRSKSIITISLKKIPLLSWKGTRKFWSQCRKNERSLN